MTVGDGPKIFISYSRADQAWAEWSAWQLQDAGVEVWLDIWELTPGADVIAELTSAARSTRRMVVLISRAYARSHHCRLERQAAAASGAVLLPFLIDNAPLPPSLSDLYDGQTVRLGGLDEREARTALLQAVAPEHLEKGGLLRRLGATSPRMPGSRPRVWNVPTRSDGFVGRAELLKQVRTALAERSRVALVGDAGMGKTHLAVEYAHRFAGEYELVWWIRAGRGSVATQLAELAVATGAADPNIPMADALAALATELRTRGRWLLILDDAHDPSDLPTKVVGDAQNGQILITSPVHEWHEFASQIKVGPLSLAESSALLRSLAPSLSASDAKGVASDLGKVPLALVQAAGTISGGVSVKAYRGELLAEADLEGPPHILENTVRLGRRRLATENPAAAALLSACSLLAPQPFQLRACVRVVDWAPYALNQLLRNPEEGEAALRSIARLGLAQTIDGAVRIHPAVQSALRDEHSATKRAEAALGAQALLLSALPRRSSAPELWQPLLPHLLAIAPEDLTRREARTAAHEGCVQLLDNGDASAAVRRLEELRQAWLELLGPDDPATIRVTSDLARGLRQTGNLAAARSLLEGALARERETWGEHAPTPLETAAQLTALLIELGDSHAALSLGERTLDQQRMTLGPDHPSTLALSADMLTVLRAVGRLEEAKALGEGTLDRQRRLLGPDHPDTLVTASRLAGLLAEVGHPESARSMYEDVIRWSGHTLGPDSPATLRAVVSLAVLLYRTGDYDSARTTMEEGFERQRHVLGKDHPVTMGTAAGLTAVLARQGRNTPALALTDQLLSWQRATLGPDDPATLRTAALLAALCLNMGNYAPARDEASDTRHRLLRVLGPHHFDTLRATVLLVACLRSTGHHAEAQEMLESLEHPVEQAIDPSLLLVDLADAQMQTAEAVPSQETPRRSQETPHCASTSTWSPDRPPGSASHRSVLVSHVRADSRWADWVRYALAELGHEVTMEAEDSYLGRPLSRESDVILVLLSPAYLGSMAANSWTASEWHKLREAHAHGRRRIILLFVHPVAPDQLPGALREMTTPALYDLDLDAARDLLRFTLAHPARTSRNPAFPGTSGPADSNEALLTRRLVNALERSATLQYRDGLEEWIRRVNTSFRFSHGEVSLRTTLYEVVRALKHTPGGMTELVDTLDLMEPDSLAVAEARRIAREIERQQENR
ncbi:FxSxx-COOH system tetratricopeptide repeat protein [Streptomyces sp. MBT62]|uniref:FxSxx-COOH system tetratricopeptide repeat protein n=1 Tax=Streptomyces sp. MBT62 TaxID=2800410 RepID=UPI00190C08C4|nr:FxSxx-COOH system tetratricopeptide repeat protein [Streptomyces sp. MBT62]MBK3566866.1 tetratricopeptide repeat protein [Streptomyces sp. MBT62]